MVYKRVLLKLSGEALMGEKPYGIDPAIVQSIAEDVSKVVENNVQLAIVVGGGTFLEGLKVLLMVWIERRRIMWGCSQQ